MNSTETDARIAPQNVHQSKSTDAGNQLKLDCSTTSHKSPPSSSSSPSLASISSPASDGKPVLSTNDADNRQVAVNNETINQIRLPDSLESLPRAEHFPSQRHRWNTNEEIAVVLINFERHMDWLAKEVKIRPKSGSMLLYSRKKVRYRRDGYCWKKRKDGKTTREDHMKLKVQGTECIYGCYVHSAILPTFHRRCYWLLQNPDIVLVHYLNVPYPDDAKLLVVASVSLWAERKEWSKEELISQLRPMFLSDDEPNLNNELEVSTAETVEAIVSQLMEKQRLARMGSSVAVNGGANPQQLAIQTSLAMSNSTASHVAAPDKRCNLNDNKGIATTMSMSTTATTIQHSLRRLSTGSLIRLEPRPQPSHSLNANQVAATTVSTTTLMATSAEPMYKQLVNSSTETCNADQYNYNGAPPNVMATSTHFVSSSAIKVPLPVCSTAAPADNSATMCNIVKVSSPDDQQRRTESMVKHERPDYFNATSTTVNRSSTTATLQYNSSFNANYPTFFDNNGTFSNAITHNTPAAPATTTSTTTELRRTDEMLSGQNYRFVRSLERVQHNFTALL